MTFRDIVEQHIIPKSNITGLNSKVTDDVIFCQREIKNIDNKINKSKYNKEGIWSKTKVNDDRDLNVRKKLMEIKRGVKEKSTFENMDFGVKGYFNKDSIQVIHDTVKIMKNKTMQNVSKMEKTNSINNFINDNREICLRNYLIDLLKGERTSISDKEHTVTRALKESENKLENDFTEFMKFTEREKRKQKVNEQRLIDYISKNKQLQEKKKKLVQENKQIMDDLDRTVKIILNLKGNASFVHTVLGDEKSRKFKDENLENKVELYGKERDLEKITEALL